MIGSVGSDRLSRRPRGLRLVSPAFPLSAEARPRTVGIPLLASLLSSVFVTLSLRSQQTPSHHIPPYTMSSNPPPSPPDPPVFPDISAVYPPTPYGASGSPSANSHLHSPLPHYQNNFWSPYGHGFGFPQGPTSLLQPGDNPSVGRPGGYVRLFSGHASFPTHGICPSESCSQARAIRRSWKHGSGLCRVGCRQPTHAETDRQLSTTACRSNVSLAT